MSSSRKRKHPPIPTTTSTTYTASTNPNPNLYIQAYEADIIRGPQATLAAASLEASNGPHTSKGSALIQLPSHGTYIGVAFPQDAENDDGARPGAKAAVDEGVSGAIWVDRYDARLLLDLDTLTLPLPVPIPISTPDSPSGWSDLPSDNEDAFFLTPDEIDDFRREKKRRHIDQVRDARVRARRVEDGVDSDDDIDQEEEDVWGGSDEEPTPTQSTLIELTATHLVSSPNPIQLEARILANHGGDPRFAFLRGRWGRAWAKAKARARLGAGDGKNGEMKKEKGKEGGLGGLVGYEDSESENESENENENDPPPAPSDIDPDEVVKEARRARAREWASKRRQADG